uniref:Putative outcast ele5 orf1-h 1e-40-j 4 n=1 Tax=Ixodes ricinus TaxID=34613 RepID=A0A0K8R810_IXORI
MQQKPKYFKCPSYSSYVLNRTSRRGGGVCLLVNKSIKCELWDDYCCITQDYEMLSVRTGNTVISVLYRPPDGRSVFFFQFCERFLQVVNDNHYDLILGGDFNIDMLKDSACKREFNILIETNGCVSVIQSPTRVTVRSETMIDLFITNAQPDKITSGTLSYDISDHLPIFLCLNTKPYKNVRNTGTFVFQDITNDRLNAFKADISEINWSPIYNCEDVNLAYNTFLGEFTTIYNRHFPWKTLKVSKKIRKPWITPELLKKIEKKNILYQKFLKTREPSQLLSFKVYRNQLTKILRKAKTVYHTNSFQAQSTRADVIWRKLNSVLNRVPNRQPVDSIVHEGVYLDGSSLANTFSDYFAGLVSDNTATDAFCSYLEYRNNYSIFLEPVTIPEVCSVFMQLKNSSSCDCDNLQIRPVKYILDLVAPCLCHIFNLSLTTGLFPEKMQMAKVAVLHKKGDKNILSNYRPLSILPLFSKGLEKIIHTRLVQFSDKHNLLTPAQFGFRKGRSTELALLEQKEYILKNFEEKKQVLGVFVDFTKAFDFINHNILLKKLERYGVRGLPLELLRSYLRHRCQYVSIGQFSSDVKPIHSGVPQGSILGPFLFNMYINDIVNISPAKFVIYADDSSLFFSSDNSDDLVTIANDTLSKLGAWAKDNYLKINTDKTKAIIFRPKNKCVNLTGRIVLDTTSIEIVSNFKSLGVIFSEHMLWDSHINHLLAKLSTIIGLTFRNGKTLPVSVKLLIYNSLFYSHMSYCNLVWGNTTFTNLQKLFLLQKKMVRILCNLPYDFHTGSLFKKFSLLKMHSLYEYRLIRSLKYKEKETL